MTWAIPETWSPLRLERSVDPEVSIIIPVHDNHLYTYNCLRSIAEAAVDCPYEVIVVDDGSQDETPTMLQAIKGIRALRHESSLGFIEACNLGGRVGRGDSLVFLNNDTVVTKGWLEALLETRARDARVGVVGARLIYPDGRLQEAGGIVWRDGSAWNYGRGDDPDRPEYAYARDVDYCSAACLLVDRALFWRLGGFDTHFAPAYYEDADLCFRARAAGFRVVYQPGATIVHWEGATAGTDTTTGVKRFQAQNQPKFVERWSGVLRAHREPGREAHLEKERGVARRALVVDDRSPALDQDGGSARMWKLIEVLQTMAVKVTFAVADLRRVEPYVARLQRAGVEVLYAPFVSSLVEHLRLVGSHYDLALLSRPDVGQAYLDAVQMLCPRTLVVYDTVDLHFVRERREAALRGDPKLLAAAGARKHVELGLVSRADVTLVVTPADRDAVRSEVPQARVEIVSDIQDACDAPPPFAPRSDLLFVGGFLHRPNVDAVTEFAERIFPLVRPHLSGVRFHIVGGQATPEVHALAAEDVLVAGYEQDLGPRFAGCRLLVAPMRFGSGVKVKISHSMSRGLPVVASALAVEGMRLRHEHDVLLADTAEDFAAAVVRLYRDEELWTRLQANALQTVERLYSRSAARATLERILPGGR